jgi:hypothetical protein
MSTLAKHGSLERKANSGERDLACHRWPHQQRERVAIPDSNWYNSLAGFVTCGEYI